MSDLKKEPHIVIIGAGFAGLTAALGLARTNAKITVIDRRNHHLFQPLLYQVATAGLSPAQIATPIRAVLRKQKNTDVILDEVTAVNTKDKKVTTLKSEINYDYLIIATGANHSYFGKDEWEKFAPGLKTVPDATSIRQNILLAFEAAETEKDPEKRRAHLNFVIVGAGPTGVELSGSIAELARRVVASDFRRIDPNAARVILIEASDRVLSGFDEALSKRAHKDLEGLGVEVLTHTRVTDVTDGGVSVSERFIPAQTVIWAAGVQASPAANWLNVEKDSSGRVFVDKQLRVPGFEDIFVLGDTAHAKDKDGNPFPGLAPVALQQGRFIAKYLRDHLKEKKTVSSFEYFDKGNLATIGRKKAVGSIGNFRFYGFFAWIVWSFVHILYLIGFRNRVLVLMDWSWSYFTFQRGARLITDFVKKK